MIWHVAALLAMKVPVRDGTVQVTFTSNSGPTFLFVSGGPFFPGIVSDITAPYRVAYYDHCGLSKSSCTVATTFDELANETGAVYTALRKSTNLTIVPVFYSAASIVHADHMDVFRAAPALVFVSPVISVASGVVLRNACLRMRVGSWAAILPDVVQRGLAALYCSDLSSYQCKGYNVGCLSRQTIEDWSQILVSRGGDVLLSSLYRDRVIPDYVQRTLDAAPFRESNQTLWMYASTGDFVAPYELVYRFTKDLEAESVPYHLVRTTWSHFDPTFASQRVFDTIFADVMGGAP